MKKESKLSNVLIFIGAWSDTKIPMLLFEASSIASKALILRSPTKASFFIQINTNQVTFLWKRVYYIRIIVYASIQIGMRKEVDKCINYWMP